MKRIFADTAYWIAIFDKRDSLHGLSKVVSRQHEDDIFVTTEMVLVEFANFFCTYGAFFRKGAGDFIQEIRNDPNVEVELQTTSLFQRGLSECARHTDKDWSLTDCASISVMRSRGLFEALTNDHHFEQAGFTILLKQE
jgi:uncharacterized protein